MKDFKKLEIWKRAHLLTLAIYRATKDFPKDEIYSLTNQIRRAAVSIPSNIAEGCGRHGDAELGRFLHISMDSASELEYQLLLVHDLGYLTPEQFQQLDNDLNQFKRMMNVFIQKLERN